VIGETDMRNPAMKKGASLIVPDNEPSQALSLPRWRRGMLPGTAAYAIKHPHLLRHACATHMLDNGAPLDVIQHLLGHDNIEITAHYAQVCTRLMMSSYNRAHPHAKAGI
jgi:site-specific recombinase XerD